MREVLGHLVMPMMVGVGVLLVETVKQRGSLHRALARIARDVARRDVTELTGHLRTSPATERALRALKS